MIIENRKDSQGPYKRFSSCFFTIEKLCERFQRRNNQPERWKIFNSHARKSFQNTKNSRNAGKHEMLIVEWIRILILSIWLIRKTTRHQTCPLFLLVYKTLYSENNGPDWQTINSFKDKNSPLLSILQENNRLTGEWDLWSFYLKRIESKQIEERIGWKEKNLNEKNKIRINKKNKKNK